jgi:tetraacyldisaccharide 4'-kinase
VTFLEALLWPLTIPYGSAAYLRAWAYRAGLKRSRRLDGVVISVGNLTTGGTGKTPMVLWIAQRLASDGKKVGILTRGYRGEASADGPTSDEVRLLKARLGDGVAFGVGADRWSQGRRLAAKGIDWFVLDDGFQHLQLARDIDIVLIDATNPFGGRHLLPAGRLREPKSALARAHVIVITRSDHAPGLEAAIRQHSQAPIFYARSGLERVESLKGERLDDTELRQRRFFAFCGIGNPKAFFNHLRTWGLRITSQIAFADHHRFTPADVQKIEAQARASGASALICTEKDSFNLPPALPSMDLFVCQISMRIAGEDEFWSAVMRNATERSQPGAHVAR